MFIAMNRFAISEGRGDEFETAWRTRESHLDEVPGFVRFALLKGDTRRLLRGCPRAGSQRTDSRLIPRAR